jgi:hypothetical protein
MKRKYIQLLDIEKGNYIVCAFLCNKFQGLGIILNTDNPLIGNKKRILFEISFLWFKFWVTYYTSK